MVASLALEAFIDETIGLSRKHGYHPTAFIGMRGHLGTVEAISRLVASKDIQSGFRRLQQLGLIAWIIETAVTKFPAEFPVEVRQAAEWRLAQAAGGGLDG